MVDKIEKTKKCPVCKGTGMIEKEDVWDICEACNGNGEFKKIIINIEIKSPDKTLFNKIMSWLERMSRDPSFKYKKVKDAK